LRTHADAPRVLIANSLLVPAWGDWDHFRKRDRHRRESRRGTGDLRGSRRDARPVTITDERVGIMSPRDS
jgi:hypothetical protein